MRRYYPQPTQQTNEPELHTLAAQLATEQIAAERELLAAICAHIFRMLPLADAAGISAEDFLGDDMQAIWTSLVFAFNSGRTRGEDWHADHCAAMPLIRFALRYANSWDDQELADSQSSTWSTAKLQRQIFEAAFPSQFLVYHRAAKLRGLRRRSDDAAAHLRYATEILKGAA